MFDWNDEELTNIIWGEAGESDDHIVPYPDQIEDKPPILFGDPTKKETNQKTENVSPAEQNKPTTKSEQGVELDSASKYDPGDSATGFSLGSWPNEPDPSLSDAAKAGQESTREAASNNTTTNSKQGSLGDETAQYDKDSGIFQNPQEDGEQGDYDDYGWANIGSFDDLDRIFSNNDPIFGDINPGNADELWSSSKDVTCSALGTTSLPGDSSDLALGPLRTSSDKAEIKPQYMLDPRHSFISGYENSNEITSRTPQDVQAGIDTIEYSGGKSKLLGKEKIIGMDGKIQACDKQLDGTSVTRNEFKDKGAKQKRVLKGQKLEKKSEVRQLHDLFSTWSSSGSSFQQFNSQYAPSIVNQSPNVVLAQQRQLQRLEPLQQKNFTGSTGQLLASPLYGNVVNVYPGPSVLAQSSGYEVPPGNSSSLKKLPAMTPKEKIEKLRRRQQMRAILAIQKQQQQFGNQAENSIMEGGKVEVDESLSSLPSLDTNSPLEHDDANTIGMSFDNRSVEESVLYQFQDVIAKLDTQIRLCIRDSLFRLAQSALQRQYCSETSSTNTSGRDGVLQSKDTNDHGRFARMPDVETDTNPIDRIVAHLLFHRPLEFSGRPDMPERPIFTDLPYEQKAVISEKGINPDDFENSQMTSPQGLKTSCVFSEVDQSKYSPRLDTPDNASNSGAPPIGGSSKAEASK